MPRVFGRTVRRRTLVIGGVVLGVAALSLHYAQKTFTLARAGTAYSAKMVCSGVLMAEMNAERLKREELSLAQGLIKTKIDSNQGVVHAWAFAGLGRGAAVRQGNLGCSQVIANKQVVRLPNQTRQQPTDPNTTKTPWKHYPDTSETLPRIDQNKLETEISQAFQEPTISAPKRTRCIVVLK